MAYRDYAGKLPPTNYIIEERHTARSRALEATHLLNTRGTLTTHFPANAGSHVKFNAKKEMQRDIDIAKIEHVNLLLLTKLYSSFSRPSSAAAAGPYSRDLSLGQRSMNVRIRRKELTRVFRENQVRLVKI